MVTAPFLDIFKNIDGNRFLWPQAGRRPARVFAEATPHHAAALPWGGVINGPF
jgi:hypothetical protein